MSGGGTYVPTVSVTSASGSASLSAGGSCEITTPSSVSSSVSCRVTPTRKPAARSVARASATVWKETSGTVTVDGPCETESVTDEPRVAVELPGGLWVTTSPPGSLLSTSTRPTVKPADWSCAAASS